MEVINNKALLLNLREPNKVTAVIPKSKAVGGNQVVVHWGLDEAQVLKNLRIKNVPSPILRDYNWPGMHKPFDHQKQTASFLTLYKRAFCLSEQGTGKTGSVIWAADYLMQQGRIRRVLVICPLSIMDSAWRGDLFKFAMHRSVDIAHGSAEKRRQVINGGAEFVIINYDGVEVVADDIANAGFDLLVVDECFVAGTLVSTPLGRRPIEQLQPGDMVLTSDGVAPIKRLVRNTATQLVEVKFGDGNTIRCTPDHPFFTDVGWVCARHLAGRRLISNVELSCLRAGLSPSEASGLVGYGEQPTNWADLFKILRTEEMALTESRQELFQQNVARATRSLHKSEDSGASSEIVSSIKSPGAQAEATGRERQRHDSDRTVDFRGLACGVGMELPRSVGREASRLSYELQARLRVASPESGFGSGWEQSHDAVASATGQEKRNQTGNAWVESVAYIECPSGVDVFNLEIEGTPNYLVGDHWVVHNCNAYKNAQTKRWKTLNSLLRPDMCLWMMTGTPAAQSPADAYGLAKLVSPNNVPRFFTTFKDMVMYKVGQFRWLPRASATQTVFKALQPAIRFTKEECLDLPEMTYVNRQVALTPQQERYYKLMKKQMIIEAGGEEITAVNAAVNLSKLLQLSCGAVYSDTGETIEFDIRNRYSVLREVIDETDKKVLIFAPFRNAIDLIAQKLTDDGYATEVIHGDVSAGKRAQIFRQFQETDAPRVLVIQPQAAAHGVTLTAADTVVWWGPTSSLETYEQANARVHRAGQRHPTTVVRLIGSNAERHVYQMLDTKKDVHSQVVDLYKRLLD